MLVISGNPSAEAIGAELSEQLNSQLGENDLRTIQIPVAVCIYNNGEKRNELLHKLDGALAQAELKGNRALIILNTSSQPIMHRNLTDWRDTIAHALQLKKLQLAHFRCARLLAIYCISNRLCVYCLMMIGSLQDILCLGLRVLE